MFIKIKIDIFGCKIISKTKFKNISFGHKYSNKFYKAEFLVIISE